MDKLKEKIEEQLKIIESNGINANNIELLYKLIKIKHIMKEDEQMQGNYGEYGYGRRGYGNYGEYGNYGRRGYDAKYRGYDALEAMGDNYGRYMESRERYGASHESSQSLKKMLTCMENFADVVKEQAQSPEEEMMMKESFKKISM